MARLKAYCLKHWKVTTEAVLVAVLFLLIGDSLFGYLPEALARPMRHVTVPVFGGLVGFFAHGLAWSQQTVFWSPFFPAAFLLTLGCAVAAFQMKFDPNPENDDSAMILVVVGGVSFCVLTSFFVRQAHAGWPAW